MSAALGSAGEPTRDEALKASGVVYDLGPHRLEYLKPDDETSPLHEQFTRNKPVPYRIRFRTDGPAQPVDAAAAARVRIEFA